jgi:hypothetical protein
MDNEAFFGTIRKTLFGGKLKQSHVDGINALLAAFNRYGITDRRQRAYMLATAKWETDHTMRPIREYGRGLPDTQRAYFGRGLVQLTHKANYRAMGERLGIDLVNRPDKALDLRTAADILVLGMRDGMFDRKNNVPLRHYLGPMKADWWQARRTIMLMTSPLSRKNLTRHLQAKSWCRLKMPPSRRSQ